MGSVPHSAVNIESRVSSHRARESREGNARASVPTTVAVSCRVVGPEARLAPAPALVRGCRVERVRGDRVSASAVSAIRLST